MIERCEYLALENDCIYTKIRNILRWYYKFVASKELITIFFKLKWVYYKMSIHPLIKAMSVSH